MSSFYSTGTASVVAGSAAVTGDGTMWAATLLPGDVFCRAGLMVPIASIESQTALTLAYGWPGASAADATYIVNYSSPTRSEPGYLAARTREALDKLGLLENNVPYYDVQSVGLNAPPASPILGDTYVVGTAPTGAWAGRAKMLAQWAGSAWAFTAPAGGWHVYSLATDQIFALVAGSWQLTDGVASVVGQTGTVTAAQIKAAIASSYFQTLMPAADAAAARSTLGVTIPWIEANLSGGGFRNLIRNARFLINQRSFASGGSLAAKAFGIDGVAGGPSGGTVAYALDGGGLYDRYLNIASGSIVLPIPGADIAGGSYRISYEGTAQYRIWAGAPSGSYATAFRSAGGAAVTLTAGVDAFVEFTGGAVLRPQVELGNMGPFERVPLDLEMSRCLPFFERQTLFRIGFGFVQAGFGLVCPLYFGRKRTTALSVTFGSPANLRAYTDAGTYGATVGVGVVQQSSVVLVAVGPPTSGVPGYLGYTTPGNVDIAAELVW